MCMHMYEDRVCAHQRRVSVNKRDGKLEAKAFSTTLGSSFAVAADNGITLLLLGIFAILKHIAHVIVTHRALQEKGLCVNFNFCVKPVP